MSPTNADPFPDASPPALFLRLVEEVFNGRDLAVLDDLLAEDFRDHGGGSGPGPPRDRAANARGVAAFLAAFPDLRQEVEAVVAAGDLVSARSTFTGTHRGLWLGLAPTGAVVRWSGLTMMRVAGGRFVERWSLADDASLRRQLEGGADERARSEPPLAAAGEGGANADAAGFPPTSWADDRVTVRESPRGGRGAFARAPIAAGEAVFRWGGAVFSGDEIRAGRAKPGTVAAIDEGVYLASPVGAADHPADALNHSCDPTLWLADAVTLVARRDIAAGEELTGDYATWEADEGYVADWPCRCGSPLCRRRITGRDWRRPDLRARYGDHISPFLARRMAALSASDAEAHFSGGQGMAPDDHATGGPPDAPPFVPGLDLAERFYREAVRPALADAFPGLPHSAALIGYGSEVLGYDTARSTDHEWGPRCLLLLADVDAELVGPVAAALAERLPATFLGFSTHFPLPEAAGERLPAAHAGGPVAHKVEVYPARGVLRSWLGFDPLGPIAPEDWLLVPQQRLLEVTAGRVFHDGLGVLGSARANLAWFPRPVWLYLMACQWQRLSQREAFVGRAGEVGDELGSALNAAALARDLVGLAFLQERRYVPYAKWLGSAFNELDAAPALGPLLTAALRAASWREREDALAAAYELLAARHNALALTPPLDPATRPYHARPFRVLHAERFVAALLAAIDDPAVRALADRAGPVGSVDQISDNTDVVAWPDRVRKLREVYR
jgi:hypothetical protein